MKKLLLTLWISLTAFSLNAAIVVDYNNDTGEFNVSGSDTGPGVNAGSQLFAWTWGSSAIAADYNTIIGALIADNHLTGTINGSPITLVNPLNTGENNRGIGVQPGNPGTLALDTTSGTIATSLWTQGVGSFTGTPSLGAAENFTVNIAIPEPSTYAAFAGAIALVFVSVMRRRKQ